MVVLLLVSSNRLLVVLVVLCEMCSNGFLVVLVVLGHVCSNRLLVVLLKEMARVETGFHRSTCRDVVQTLEYGCVRCFGCIKRVPRKSVLRRKACV